eukprot:TRINITY_DN1169_c0_g1_i3.p1 TRINITY_DN1169_c0_g1~~TRINITY_DN1169_c0_g1_i3.p1  ORF type:complete len:261 (+),score=64.09 TRINITY_DN1169_c0_g1_i3:60-842(+)
MTSMMKAMKTAILVALIGGCSNLQPNDKGFMEFVTSSRNFKLPLQRALLRAFIAKCGRNSQFDGETVLMGCALKGNIFCAKELLSVKAVRRSSRCDINQLNGEHSALTLAIMSHSNSVFDLLVSYKGIQVLPNDIKLAFIRNNNHAAEVLLKNCDDINKWIDVEDVDSLVQHTFEDILRFVKQKKYADARTALQNHRLLLTKGFNMTLENYDWVSGFIEEYQQYFKSTNIDIERGILSECINLHGFQVPDQYEDCCDFFP